MKIKKNDKKKPNFFIIGAPKCGTTALAKYLGEHDQIFVSTPKEPHYFATDFENYRNITTEKEYEDLFLGVHNEVAIGEASVFYLYSKKALENIKKYNPDSKIILMIRNPVEMIPSLHSQVVYSGDENILNFNEAWESCTYRKRSEKITNNARDAQILFYDEIAKYAEQIVRVKKYFDDDKIKVIFFEEFSNDCQNVYEESLRFLDVAQDGRTEFPRINENKKLKSLKLNTTIKRIPSPVKSVYNFIKSSLKIEYGLSLTKRLNEFNTVIEKRDPIDKHVKVSLINNYKNDILKLEKMFNRDLSDWMR